MEGIELGFVDLELDLGFLILELGLVDFEQDLRFYTSRSLSLVW